MSALPPTQHDWHDATDHLLTDEERAQHRRTRRWIIGLVVFLLAWIPLILFAFR
jgi:hypothetical protein